MNTSVKTNIVIPARLASSRLANKLLLDLGGKSVIQRVYEQCIKAKKIDAVYIAVDHKKLQKHCSTFTKNVILTSADHQSGTDRIAEAVPQLPCDNVINVQGDEPFIDPQLIDKLSECLTNKEVQMCSAMTRFSSAEALLDPNNVKVVTDAYKNALYFSRAPIPYYRDQALDVQEQEYFQHIGIYGYKKSFVLKLAEMPPTFLENTEKLEQLRVLENGIAIKMIETQHQAPGIDTMEDYQAARERLNN